MPQQHDWAPRLSPPFNGTVYRYTSHSATDPLDGSFAMRSGGRWNPPNSFPVLYTSCSLDVAIANLWHRFEGEAVQPWEVAEERQADLHVTRHSRLACACTERIDRACGADQRPSPKSGRSPCFLNLRNVPNGPVPQRDSGNGSRSLRIRNLRDLLPLPRLKVLGSLTQ